MRLQTLSGFSTPELDAIKARQARILAGEYERPRLRNQRPLDADGHVKPHRPGKCPQCLRSRNRTVDAGPLTSQQSQQLIRALRQAFPW